MGPSPPLRLLLAAGLARRLGGGYQNSLSSLPSIARRFLREQVSQKLRRRPCSTEIVHVSVAAPSGSWRPQKSQVIIRASVRRAGRPPP